MFKNHCKNPIKVCRTCGVILSKENMFPSWYRDKLYYCKECGTKNFMNNYEKNGGKEKALLRSQQYYTGTTRNGKSIVLIGEKRFRKTKCELCNKNMKVANYHHWNDKNLKFGMWICFKCHILANAFEWWMNKVTMRNRYLQLKEDIENGKA